MSDENVDLNFVNMPNRYLGTEGEEDSAPLLDNEVEPDCPIIPGHELDPADNPELDTPAAPDPSEIKSEANPVVTKWSVVSIIILTFINLLNYMDRYSIAGVLSDIQNYYLISDTMAGLIQTTFVISYMCLSPLFGYLGDRYNRRLIMSVGIFIWSSVTLGSSFIGQNQFGLFLFLRALVGIGEASYSTIAPTIIADLFYGTQRTKALSVFYFAIPVGSGLGYITGSMVAQFFGSWHWALRVTPVFGLICSVLVLFLVREPRRGAADHSTNLHTTSWLTDIKYLLTHKSFMLSSFGVTCVAFVSGALALWAPTYITKSLVVGNPRITEDAIKTRVSMTFGVITCAAGFLGVMLGSYSASKLRRYTGKADPFVCAFGLLTSAPFLFLSLFLSRYNEYLTWILIFIGETLLCLNWTVVADILLYLVIPTRRSSAEAIQILLSHLLGDAGSPFLVGAISDAIQRSYSTKGVVTEYIGLEYALYMTSFVCVIGGGFFLFCAIFIEKDRDETERMEREAMVQQRDETVTTHISDEVVSESNHLSADATESECV